NSGKTATVTVTPDAASADPALTVTPADHTSIAPQVTADAAGKATVSLTSKLPGDKTVTATVTGSGNH
uniref:hypothetical protein n=1 Tax=Salmonella enterica TaxID=28901 RepID=UPI00159212F3